jgi:predicted RNA-binding protein YlxR (DUF448 family)
MMTASEQNQRHQRTCVGCTKTGAPEGMVRLVLGGAGDVAVDAAGGAFGRGAHVHPSRDCIEAACRGGLSRAFKRDVRLEPAALRANIREAFIRRAAGMILGARRAGHLAVGTEATLVAWDGKKKPGLVVLAADAGSIVSRFERAVAEGRAVVFGTKPELGELFGTSETAVFAVCHEGVARALKHVIEVVHGSGSEER